MTPHRPEPDETLEGLADRLRRLPPPPVPAGLEGRLLADIPSRPHFRRLRFRLAAAALLAAAAAALFAVRLPQRAAAPAASGPPPAKAAPTWWAYEQALRDPTADATVAANQMGPLFEWPVAGPGPTLLSDRLAEPTH